jgi:hypothetical protein
LISYTLSSPQTSSAGFTGFLLDIGF